MNHELLKSLSLQFYVPAYNPVIYFMLYSNAAKRRGCFLMLSSNYDVVYYSQPLESSLVCSRYV